MAIPDLTTLTDAELLTMGDHAVRVEIYRRKNLVNMPLSKAAADTALLDFPKSKLALTVEQDEIDGEYVVVDTGGNNAIMSSLMASGGVFKSASKVRISATNAVKDGGVFETLEALL